MIRMWQRTTRREEVLDVTIASRDTEPLIYNWHVSKEISMSDHKRIIFSMRLKNKVTEEFRNPRSTNWSRYNSSLQTKLSNLHDEISTVEALELRSERVRECIIEAYEENCPKRQKTFR